MEKRIFLIVFACLLTFAGSVAASRISDNLAKDDGTIVNVGNDEKRRLVSSKLVYQEEEPIYLTVYTPILSERIVVCRVGEKYAKMVTMRVGETTSNTDAYISGPGSGVPFDVRNYISSSYNGGGDAFFSPGEYIVYFLPTEATMGQAYTTLYIVVE